MPPLSCEPRFASNRLPNFQLEPAHNRPPAVVSDEPLETGFDAEALRRQVAELTHENAGLKEAVAARDTFLAIAGHELRNPMTPILGQVDLLKRLVSRPDFEPDRVSRGSSRSSS
jgi:signal transduction histidine kinase